MKKILVEETLLKNILSSMDMMLNSGEWYCAQERADALREVLWQNNPRNVGLAIDYQEHGLERVAPVLVGSRALAFWMNMPIKDGTDWDVISENPIEGTEHHPIEKLNNLQMATFYSSTSKITLPNGTSAYVMTMEGLAILKRSHLHRDLSFYKHLTHYHKWGLADVVRGEFFDFDLRTRTDLTKKEYPVKHPNLMQSKADFFSDGVTKVYDHDWLHCLYAYGEHPKYVDMLRHSDMAWCDKSKWGEVSSEEKCQCVAEEVYVIATERFMIPNNWEYSAHKAFMKALEKVCTTLCSGWFRDYAIDNYPDIFRLYSPKKFETVYNTILATPESKRIYHVSKGK